MLTHELVTKLSLSFKDCGAEMINQVVSDQTEPNLTFRFHRPMFLYSAKRTAIKRVPFLVFHFREDSVSAQGLLLAGLRAHYEVPGSKNEPIMRCSCCTVSPVLSGYLLNLDSYLFCLLGHIQQCSGVTPGSIVKTYS